MSHVKDLQSPFLDVTSFPREEAEAVEDITTVPSTYSSSPFVSAYEMEGGESRVDHESEEFIQLLGELYDDEFNDAVFELVNEASALYEDQFSHDYRDKSSQSREGDRFLSEHFAPLENELEILLDRMADDIQHHDFEAMTEVEINSFVDSYQFNTELSPNFENFWGWAKKKLKKAAKWAKKKAKGLAARAFRAALKKIKRYLRPMLKKVLTFAIGKLPRRYQGLANRLRKRLGYEIEEESNLQEGQDTTGEIDQIQREFDLFIANLLYSDDETQHELILSEIVNESEQPVEDSLTNLDSARNQFIEGILDLKEGEDSEQLVENFLPAIMPRFCICDICERPPLAFFVNVPH